MIVPRQTNGICAFGEDEFPVTAMRDFAIVGCDGTVRTGPCELPGFYTSGIPRSDGRCVVVTARSAKRVALYDFTKRTNQRLLRSWKLSGNPDADAFLGVRVLIPAGRQGLLVTKERW